MTNPPMSGSSGDSPTASSEYDVVRDAIRYWEPRRVGYNFALTALATGWVLATWPRFRAALTPQHVVQLLILVGLANVAYCAAYLVDVLLQHSQLRERWRRRRAGLWWAGTLFALLLEYYWIGDEIYPYLP